MNLVGLREAFVQYCGLQKLIGMRKLIGKVKCATNLEKVVIRWFVPVYDIRIQLIRTFFVLWNRRCLHEGIRIVVRHSTVVPIIHVAVSITVSNESIYRLVNRELVEIHSQSDGIKYRS